jgi:hypothetical protein
MSRTSSTNRTMETHKNFSEKLLSKRWLGKFGEIILKWILTKTGMRMRTEFNWLRAFCSGWLLRTRKYTFCFHKNEFLDQLSDRNTWRTTSICRDNWAFLQLTLTEIKLGQQPCIMYPPMLNSFKILSIISYVLHADGLNGLRVPFYCTYVVPKTYSNLRFRRWNHQTACIFYPPLASVCWC